mmetsp:Transcript_41488/g.129892  ORF Transcript_41488/g.129892 Transcript_41488/m.129892 type:complete len:371 (-) Transcript_41488:347-1459(-)
MGGCASRITALGSAPPQGPTIFIPDPEPGESHLFTLRADRTRRAAIRCRDMDVEVMRGENPDRVTDRWLRLRCEVDGKRPTVDVENYVRGWDRNRPFRGKVLYAAKFSKKEIYEKTKPRARVGARARARALAELRNGKKAASRGELRREATFQNDTFLRSSDDSGDVRERPSTDIDYFDRATMPNEAPNPMSLRIVRWKLETEVLILAGPWDEGDPEEPLEEMKDNEAEPARLFLKVFATGAVVAGEYALRHESKDGEVRKDKTKQFVDFVDFALYHEEKNGSRRLVDEWRMRDDLERGADGLYAFRTRLFAVGWKSPTSDKRVVTAPEYAPSLSLLLAHLTTVTLSPQGILENFNPPGCAPFERTEAGS